jgi:hypothetical protein
MRARCYHCQNAFDTDRFGVQRCPSCGTEVYLPDPAAAQPPASEPRPPEVPPPGEPRAPAEPAPAPPATAAPPPPPPWGAPPPAMPGQPPGAGMGAPPPQGLPPGWGPPPGWPPPPGWGPLPAGALPPIAEQSAPFAERARRGVVSSFIETWRLAALEPARFFRQVRVSQAGSAVLFGVISVTIGTWVSLLFRYATASATLNFMGQITRRMGGRVETFPFSQVIQGFTLGAFAVQMLLAPLFVLAGLYLTAAIFHVLLLLVRGSTRGFDATLTVVGYASGVMLLEALPLCGGIVAIVWFMVAAITGLAEAQRCGGGKAAFAVLMPLVLSCVCACLGGAALVPFLSEMFKGNQAGGTRL